jgi:tRNA modification GTPase
MFQDTIYALSTGRLPAGIAIVRISGPHAWTIGQALAGELPPPGKSALRAMTASDGRVLDCGLLLAFRRPHSFTGEDCVELHLHGGRAVVAAVLSEIGEMPGTRLAEPGEFTRRAFLNGKVDLVEAEALADLVAAETESQRRLALDGVEGRQSQLYAGWRRRIIHAVAMIEAELDFADEGDVPGSVAEAVWTDVAKLAGEIDGHIGSFHRAEIVRDGFQVVILGRPNAGKSSLLNALARRDVAIVTEEPGTTRDLIDVALDLDGQKVVITDTAGIRDGGGRIETIGIERALGRAKGADLIVRVQAADDRSDFALAIDGVPQLVVLTKSDLLAGQSAVNDQPFDVACSALSGDGIDTLMAAISDWARAAIGEPEDVLPARQRHVGHLERASGHLKAVALTNPAWLEIRAEELRAAARAFGAISGEIDVEDVLDAVFSQFCIGK